MTNPLIRQRERLMRITHVFHEDIDSLVNLLLVHGFTVDMIELDDCEDDSISGCFIYANDEKNGINHAIEVTI